MRESSVQLIRRFSKPLSPEPVDMHSIQEQFRDVPRLVYGTMPFPVVLFDLYGTLLQSASGEIGSLLAEDQRTRERNSPPMEPLEPFLSILPKEEPLATARKWFIEEVERRHQALRSSHLVPEIRVEEVWASILGLSEEEAFEFGLRFELTVNPVYPMPGAREYLDFLKGNGIVMGIVSNAQSFTPLVMEALFEASLPELGFLPDLTIFSCDLREAKPSPRIFGVAVDALERMGYKPQDALYIGNDLRNDVWAPQQVGLRAALFCGDGRSLRLRREDPLCGGTRPDYLIERFK
ncbi:MAG: HAD family hydrolase [Spirochaetales bacterium]